MDCITEDRIKTMFPLLDEKLRRIYLAKELESLGHGGLKSIHELTGVSKTTIIKAKKELVEGTYNHDRIRKIGAGRKPISQKYPNINDEIEKIIKNDTLGTPEKYLLWTTKSLRNIKTVLNENGFDVSHDTLGNLLKEMGYSLQRNQKMLQVRESHPDRNSQFEFINKKCDEFIENNQPVISVDTKKK
jgi:transposase